MLFPNDNVTCISPWYEIRINPNGSVTYCQAAPNVSDSRPESFVHWFQQGDFVTQIRHSLQQGMPVKGCGTCYNAEKNKQISHRNRRNIQAAIYQESFDESLRNSLSFPRLSNVVTNNRPSFIHVSFSNLCNLSCRMCYPAYSTNLYSTFKKAKIVTDESPLKDWTDDQDLWDSFVDLVLDNDQLVCLHIMGGEPLLQKKFYELIDLCIQHSKTDFHLTFVTNGTHLSTEIIDKLKKFKSVQLEISVENFHQTNDYIRLGSDFEKVKKNIKNLLLHSDNKFQIVLRTVFQALSAENYITILDFALENCLTIDNNFLFGNEFLHSKILPTVVKNKLVEDLTNFKLSKLGQESENYLLDMRSITDYQQDLQRIVDSVVLLLSEPETDDIESLRSQFIKYNTKLDLVSNKNFLNYYPSLREMYEKYS